MRHLEVIPGLAIEEERERKLLETDAGSATGASTGFGEFSLETGAGSATGASTVFGELSLETDAGSATGASAVFGELSLETETRFVEFESDEDAFGYAAEGM